MPEGIELDFFTILLIIWMKTCLGGKQLCAIWADRNMRDAKTDETVIRLRPQLNICRKTTVIWPPAHIVPSLVDSNPSAFEAANLRLLDVVYHGRWYVLKLNENVYFEVRFYLE